VRRNILIRRGDAVDVIGASSPASNERREVKMEDRLGIVVELRFSVLLEILLRSLPDLLGRKLFIFLLPILLLIRFEIIGSFLLLLIGQSSLVSTALSARYVRSSLTPMVMVMVFTSPVEM